jgi:5-methyltetrahydropteroyltriglutamate--homocysteine methyltransferase
VALPTEPIGSLPRPQRLLEGMQALAEGRTTKVELDQLYEEAVRDTIARMEETGSPVITDGEQRKPSFATYPIDGLEALAPDGVTITFQDGHTRQLPRLTAGPFRYRTYAGAYLEAARPHAHLPLKQAVISASALSLLYPQVEIDGYGREAFLDDLVSEAEADIRSALAAGAHSVQVDFTEGRLAVKLDPSKRLLNDFVALNNRVLERFSPAERERLGVHTCPGGDRDSTHSADVDYAELMPSLFELEARNFLRPTRQRARPQARAPHHRRVPAAQPDRLRRRDRSDRSAGGDPGGGMRACGRGRRADPSRSAGYDRRLRLRPVRRRHLDRTRDRVREDPRPRSRHRARRPRAQSLSILHWL